MPATTDNWPEIEKQSREALPEQVVDYIDRCRRGPHPESQIINILHKVQSHYGYLPEEQLDAVSQLMQIPTAKVTGIATFYHFFRLVPRGKFVINVCLGTACYVKGAQQIVEKLQEELGIRFGETTKDGIFSLEASRCLGMCGLAPAITIGSDVYGQVTPDQVPVLIAKYVAKAKEPEPAS